MIATLIGKDVMYKITLPEFIRGNYSISSENDKKLINIEAINGKWQVVSNNSFKIIDPKEIKNINNYKILKENSVKTLENIILKEYSFNYILFNNSKDIWILYCSPICEEYVHLDRNISSEILIGQNKDNHISFDNNLVKEKHARIYYSNGKLLLENYDRDYGCFVNNKHVHCVQTHSALCAL